jgi:UDP-N-acetylmuramoylalanine--D-glutamate ligase
LESTSLKETIEMAMRLSKPGTTVLLSPACASFDLFRNYEDRGNQFRLAVQEFKNQFSSIQSTSES